VELAPRAVSTPITVHGMSFMRMILPTGLSSAKRLSTTVWPRTQTAEE
jgi:hypothetical protein